MHKKKPTLFCLTLVDDQACSRTLRVIADHEEEALIAACLKPYEIVKKMIKIQGVEGLLFEMFSRSPKEQDIALTFSKIARLLAVKMPLEKAFRIQIPSVKSIRSRYMFLKIIESFSLGKGIHQSFAEHPIVFSKSFLAMLESAEKSGDIEHVLNRIALSCRNRNNLRKKIMGQLIYPGIVFLLGSTIVTAFSFFFIPELKEIYDSFNAPLPYLTYGLYRLTSLIRAFPPLAAIPLVLGILGLKYKKTIFESSFFQKCLYAMPKLGHFLRKKDCAMAFESIALLLSSGIPLCEAITMASEVSCSQPIGAVMLSVAHSVQEGLSLSNAFSKVSRELGEESEEVIGVITVGEETGDLEKLLSALSQDYQEDVSHQVDNFNKVLGPVLTLGLALFGSLIIATILYPLTRLTQVFMQSAGL